MYCQYLLLISSLHRHHEKWTFALWIWFPPAFGIALWDPRCLRRYRVCSGTSRPQVSLVIFPAVAARKFAQITHLPFCFGLQLWSPSVEVFEAWFELGNAWDSESCIFPIQARKLAALAFTNLWMIHWTNILQTNGLHWLLHPCCLAPERIG